MNQAKVDRENHTHHHLSRQQSAHSSVATVSGDEETSNQDLNIDDESIDV